MKELIAKKYMKAIKNGSDISSMESMSYIFSALAESFKDEKFVQVIESPNVNKDQKSEILLSAVKSANSSEIDNLIKLLAEHNRLNIIPELAEVMRKDIAHTRKVFSGYVYSDSDIGVKVLEDLSNGLSAKFDSKISLSFVKNDFNGIKVDVEDLGIEVNFSKSRINDQMIEHIVKAI